MINVLSLCNLNLFSFVLISIVCVLTKTVFMTKFLYSIKINIPYDSLFLILLAIYLPICATSQISAGFTTSSPTNGCGSLIVDFQDLSTGMPDTWLWDFGNGNTSIQSNPTAIYSSPGVYDVKLIVSNNCNSLGLLEARKLGLKANVLKDQDDNFHQNIHY